MNCKFQYLQVISRCMMFADRPASIKYSMQLFTCIICSHIKRSYWFLCLLINQFYSNAIKVQCEFLIQSCRYVRHEICSNLNSLGLKTHNATSFLSRDNFFYYGKINYTSEFCNTYYETRHTWNNMLHYEFSMPYHYF